MIIATRLLSKSFVFKSVFCPYDNEKPRRLRFQIPPVSRAFSEKLRFRDGLVWKVGLTVKIKLRFQPGFQIPAA